MEDLTSSSPIEINNEKKDENLITFTNVTLLLGCIFLGFSFNYLFYGKAIGISHPIFVVLFYAIFMLFNKEKLSLKTSKIILLGIPILAISFTYFLFSNYIFRIINFFGIIILVSAYSILICNINNVKWFQGKFLEEIIRGIFIKPLKFIYKPFSIATQVVNKAPKDKYSNVYKVLKGLIVASPLVIIVLLLLSSADKIFSDLLNNIPDFFVNISLSNIIIRGILIAIVGLLSFSFIWGFSVSKYENTKTDVTTKEKKFFDPISTATVLFLIDIIYLIFVAIQFSYLFSSLLPDDFTYSEYARRGFFELNVVTLINLVILLLNINFTKPAGNVANTFLKALNSIMVICTLVMLVSAFFKMSMYEDAYGYTYLRILSHAFIIFIFMLLIVSFIKIWNIKMPLMKSYIIIGLASFIIINYVNVDAIIANFNLERYESTDKIDARYLKELSYDAVPYLVTLLDCDDEKARVIIENHLYDVKEKLNKEKSWQSFNLSEYRAKKELAKYELNHSINMR